MFNNLFKFISILVISFFNINNLAYSEIVNKIEISGNERIADETIKMFSQVILKDDLNEIDINNLLKRLYDTNFFKDVSIELSNNKLSIFVVENPIIENIYFEGIKSKSLKTEISEQISIKARSSYNEVFLKKNKDQLLTVLKDMGYYFSKVDIDLVELKNNKIDLIFNINLGEKAKIRKISFIGNKIFKDNKLKSLIVSEEYKFWKFISGKKYLNENMINFDKRLLKNFYLNKGYYDVKVNSSFAKLINDNEFELVFSIDAKNKFYFGELKLDLPTDFEISNFQKLDKFFSELKNKNYSLNSVEKILNEIDKIALNEQYESIKASVNENIVSDKINLTFKIEETEKFYVEKINIFGNSITRENVIRNQFYLDEGDPYNEILANKTSNEIKSLNFFSEVKLNTVDGTEENLKIINIIVEEKPTGEIMAGAGFGTDGEVIEFGVKENNYLGKGISVDSNLSLGSDKITGKLNIKNPNFKNTDKSINFGVEAIEINKLANYGYKSKRVGSSLGTNFEYLEDFRLGVKASTFLEDIETDSTASNRQKKQEGNYFDTYLKFDFDYDKRNQKFQTSDGFRSYYSIDLPLVSDNNTLTNFYNYKAFTELYENNISSFSLSLSSANSLTGDDIKLSERLYVPGRKLRGFVNGAVGPKDGDDFIGGNYYAIINMKSNLPQIFPNVQTVDLGTFIDIANIWGVDDDSLDESNKIRSSIGIGIDWFTPVGPLTFSIAQPVTKNTNDKTETFRFNLGTTF